MNRLFLAAALVAVAGCQQAQPPAVNQTVNASPDQYALAQPIVTVETVPVSYVGPRYIYRGSHFYYWGAPYYGYYACRPGVSVNPVCVRTGPRVVVNAPFVHVDAPVRPRPVPVVEPSPRH
jgi:hypothetical protein